jgi:hypothetical protein
MAGMLLSLWAAVALAGDLEEELARRWVGAWVVVLPEVASDCSGFYTNTEVRGRLAASKGRHRFQAGELAQVDKLKLASGRVDLYLTLAETLLVPRREGPFELFDERTCKVQLMVELPREVVHARRVEGVMEVLASAAVAFPTRAEAEGSPQWNGRRRAAYPADYELTLAQYAAWKAEQENARVSEVRERAADAAAAVVGRLSDDPSYLAGLAAGVEALRSFRPASCALLGTMSFSAAERPAPREHAGDTPEAKAWRRGFRDGQELAYSLALLREARNCFVPVPPVPPAP